MSQGPEFWVKIHQRKLPGGGSEDKASARSAGDPGSIPGSGRSPREGNGYPLWYSRLENSMDRGAWWATVHGVTKGQTPHTHIHTHISMSVWYFSFIMEIILLTYKLIY